LQGDELRLLRALRREHPHADLFSCPSGRRLYRSMVPRSS
jgi:hypothetical protein